MTDPANPNPSRITDEVWWFRCRLLELEPGTDDQDGGIYANKSGYHNTRAANSPDDYSVRDAPDKKGPSDKAAAFDWTFISAQKGDYNRISHYGKLMLAAWENHDPRCNVLREFLGQTDMDATAEGLDFRYHTKRTPDSSHAWHDHFSFVRAYVDVKGALAGPLSVLAGESLDDYLLRGGKCYKSDGTGELPMTTPEVNLKRGRPAPSLTEGKNSGVMLDDLYGQEAIGASPYDGAKSARTKLLDQMAADLKKVKEDVAEILKLLQTGGGGGSVSGGLTPGDHDAIKQDVKNAMKEGTA